MAKNDPRVTYIPAKEADFDTQDAETDEREAFERYRSDFKADDTGFIRVQRVTQEKGGTGRIAHRGTFLFTCSVDEYTLDELLAYIRDNYGGGMFRIIGTKTGLKGTAFSKIVTIEEPRSNSGQRAQKITENSDGIGSVLDKFTTLMLEQQKRMDELMTRMAEQRGDSDPIKAMQATLTMLATAKGLFTAQGGNGGILEELKKYREISELIGSGETGANVNDLLGKAIDVFGRPLANIVSAGMANQRPPVATVVATPQLTNSGAPQMPPVDPNIEKFRTATVTLLKLAKRQIDPDEAADLVLDATPPNQLDSLYKFIGAANCMEILITMNPEIQEYTAWFEQLRHKIIVQIAPDQDLTKPGDVAQPELNPADFASEDNEQEQLAGD